MAILIWVAPLHPPPSVSSRVLQCILQLLKSHLNQWPSDMLLRTTLHRAVINTHHQLLHLSKVDQAHYPMVSCIKWRDRPGQVLVRVGVFLNVLFLCIFVSECVCELLQHHFSLKTDDQHCPAAAVVAQWIVSPSTCAYLPYNVHCTCSVGRSTEDASRKRSVILWCSTKDFADRTSTIQSPGL